MPKNLIDDVFAASPNRRSFLKKIGIATAAIGALSVAGATPAEAQTMTELSVLKFALNLEYLEAEFYTYALYGTSITTFGIGIDGTANGSNPTAGGATTGGSKVAFSNNLVFTSDIAAQIGTDERAHVMLLRTALGGDRIAKPNINLNALGFGFGNQNDFLKLARIFEDIGVSAYGGAAGLLTTPSIITTAARILAAEAQHVGTIRTQVARLNVPTAPLDGADIIPPPSGTRDHYLSINPSNGLTAIRTPGQVLFLAFGMKAGVYEGGFFPTGVNGDITQSTAAATSANLA
ncbi:MAG TPA: ferritin-like domain-containing protein [Edaphobacter sp.]|nr:ferritin-like domain-containing protein [Edaphobacter sp.]